MTALFAVGVASDRAAINMYFIHKTHNILLFTIYSHLNLACFKRFIFLNIYIVALNNNRCVVCSKIVYMSVYSYFLRKFTHSYFENTHILLSFEVLSICYRI